MDLNQMIDVAQGFKSTDQAAAINQDGMNKAAFAMNILSQLPQEQPKPQEPPRIPNLGAMAIPS